MDIYILIYILTDIYTDNRGNFLDMLYLIAEYDDNTLEYIQSARKNAKYTSPHIQNQMVSTL